MVSEQKKEKKNRYSLELDEEDVYEAMKKIPGYLDVTPGDLKEIYHIAYQHALDRIARSVKARDIMTHEVISAGPDTPLEEIARLMARHNVSGVPVVTDEGAVLGVISEKDFIAKISPEQTHNFMTVVTECVENTDCLADAVRGLKARDIMSSPAIIVQEDTLLKDITRLLAEKGINRLPVIDEKGRLAGIVSRGDILVASFSD